MNVWHAVIFLHSIYLIQIVFSHSTNLNVTKSNDEVAATKNYLQQMTNNDVRNIEVDKVPWYLKVPLLPILFATSPALPEGECKRQVKKYLEELDNGTLWAVRMFDASTKYPEGIITGHTRHYGNFDECYKRGTTIENDLSKQDAEVIGKYCLVKVKYQKLNSSDDHVGPYTLEFDSNGSVWETIKERGDFRRVKRYLLELALCVPDACSVLEIEEALNVPLKRIGIEQGLDIRTEIKGQCQAQKDSPEFSIGAKIYCYIIFGLFVLVGVSTWYYSTLNSDEEKKNESLTVNILLCFSAQRNIKSIIDISYGHPGLDCIYLFRCIFTFSSIFVHRLLQYYTNPTINSEFMEHTYTIPSYMILYNSTILIEIFFTFGGILLSYYVLLELDKRKKINFIAAILIRYIRFTPSYLVVIGFIALILPHLGSGPYWEYKIGLETDSCAENWWTNILYINNYVNTDKLCMFQSWYISVDYHLYIIALFVVYFFWKMPRTIGYPFLIVIIIAGCGIQFALTYLNNVQPIFRFIPEMHEMKKDLYFIEHYVKTHERFATYFVGVLGGAVIYDYKLSTANKPPYWMRLSFIIGAFVLGYEIMSMGSKFYNPNVISTPLENAIYASLSRPAFALVTVIIIIALSASDRSEFYYKIVTPRWAQSATRLTYGVYLMHTIIQSYHISTARNARTYSIDNAIWDFVPDVVFSFFLAFILSLIIEGPLRKIENLLTKKLLQKHGSVNKSDPLLVKKSN